jgi:hypothetical protein
MPDVEATFQPRLGQSGPFLPPTTLVVPLSSAMFVDPDTAVATEQQNGTPGAPFKLVQPAADALSGVANGTVVLVPGVYATESVTVGANALTFLGLASQQAGCDLGQVDITSAGDVAIVGVANLMKLATPGLVRILDSKLLNAVEFGVSLESGDAEIINSTVGTIQIGVCEAWGSTFLNGGTASRITGFDCSFEQVDTGFQFLGGGGELFSCDWFADLLADSPTFRNCNLAGSFTGSNFAAYSSRLLGGSVNVSVTIGLDQATYQSASPLLWTATNGVFTYDAPRIDPASKQIGWNAATVSSLFTVLVANQHGAGLYLVYCPLIVRTVATAGTATRTVSWSAPTIGAQTKVDTGFLLTTLGTKAQDATVIMSSGAADVTVRYAPVGLTGTPAIDLYASAMVAGYNT